MAYVTKFLYKRILLTFQRQAQNLVLLYSSSSQEMYNGFGLYSSSGKSNHKTSTVEGVECSVNDRICNFLIYVKSDQEKVHLVPVSRESNIETLIFVFQTWIQ